MTERLLAGLNQEQYQAVTSLSGYVRVLAGAGTGKTRALTCRYVYLVNEIGESPRKVWCVTFTNKAALEMRERISRMCGRNINPFVTTFHGFCCLFLRDEIHALGYPANFGVLSVRDCYDVLAGCLETMQVNGRELSQRKAWDMIDCKKGDISYVADLCHPDSLVLLNRHDELMAELRELDPVDEAEKAAYAQLRNEALFYLYLYRTRQAYALDFDDLIAFTLQILKSNPDICAKWQSRMEHILIDEYQDIDTLQNELVEILSAQNQSLFVVGDPDQTIYSFRGARVEFFTGFALRHPETETVVLYKNYRSQQDILKAAFHVIRRNDIGMPRRMLEAVRRDISADQMLPAFMPRFNAERSEGDRSLYDAVKGRGLLADLTAAPECKLIEAPPQSLRPLLYHCPNAGEEARFIAEAVGRLRADHPSASIAVLVRARHSIQAVEKELILNRIRYQVYSDVRFFDRAEIRDVLGYIRLCLNSDDDAAFRRVVNVPRRGFGRAKLHLVEEEAAQVRLSLFAGLCRLLAGGRLKADRRLTDFVRRVRENNQGLMEAGVLEALENILNSFAYEAMLKDEGDNDRLNNLNLLRQMAKDFEAREAGAVNLADFAAAVALFSAMPEETDHAAVQVMTVHNSKGLEFDYVLVPGLNEGVFPTQKSNTAEALEEERRLLYVAMTRARRQLILSQSAGQGHEDPGLFQSRMQGYSRFLDDLNPDDVLQVGGDFPLGGGYPDLREQGAGFKIGDRVFHRVLGAGEIKGVDSQNGEYEIYFDKLRRLKTLSFAAPLEKADREVSDG